MKRGTDHKDDNPVDAAAQGGWKGTKMVLDLYQRPTGKAKVAVPMRRKAQ